MDEEHLYIAPNILISECRQGMPCSHCLSLDNGKTFNKHYGHDIYELIKGIVSDKIRTEPEFTHLYGMYQANILLKYRPFNPITNPPINPENTTHNTSVENTDSPLPTQS